MDSENIVEKVRKYCAVNYLGTLGILTALGGSSIDQIVTVFCSWPGCLPGIRGSSLVTAVRERSRLVKSFYAHLQ